MKIKKNDLMIALAVISYLKPANVLLWPRINYIYALLKIVATAWILLEFLKQKKGISRIAVECLLFLTIWAISIFRNNGTLGEYTQQIASIIGLLILFEVISTKERLKYLISVVSTLGKIYFVLELVTIFTNKPLFAEITEGYDRYFLGSDNYSAFIMIPVCGFIIVNSLIKHGRITASTWSFAIAGFFALAIPFSVTAMISYGLLLIVVFLTVHHFTLKMVDYKKIIAITVVFLILVVRFSVQNRLMWLLGKIGKVGLNSRDIIWPRTDKIIDDCVYELDEDKALLPNLKILDESESIELLLQKPKSFCRYGDGEIKLMQGISQAFQVYDEELAQKLRNTLSAKREDMYIGINRAYFHSPINCSEENRRFYRIYSIMLI